MVAAAAPSGPSAAGINPPTNRHTSLPTPKGAKSAIDPRTGEEEAIVHLYCGTVIETTGGP